MDSKTKKSYKEIGDTLNGIKASMKSLATSTGASAQLNELAKKARKLQPLYKAIEDVKNAEAEYLKLMKSSKATIHEQVKSYNKLAAAKRKQIQIGNEQKGMMGRLKNVMGGFGKANILLAIGMGILRDASIIAKQAGEGFDVMARSGQALNKTFEELGYSTGNYMVQLNAASIAGATWGHTATDSKQAFQLLVQTLGGTDAAVSNVSNNFGEFAKIAKYSGISLGDAAAYADKNWKRLGKTVEDSNDDMAQMGLNTANLNSLFGEGSVDTKEYARTVSDLAFQSGNYNQNTKFLIESLNREVAIQLSLGKSREAAMGSAKRNLERAGKVNLLGIQMLAQKLEKEFEGREVTLEAMQEKFGSEGEMVYEMFKTGKFKGNDLFALAEVAKDSSELQGAMQNMYREDAARGGTALMATGAGNYGQQRLMQIQEERRDVEFEAVKTAKEEDLPKALEAIFADFEGAGKRDIDAFAKALREDPQADARAEFEKVILAIKPKEGKKDPVEAFLEQVKGEAVVIAIAALTTLPDAIKALPVSIALALAAAKAAKTGVGKKVLGFLGGMGEARRARSGMRQSPEEREESLALGKEYDKLKKQKDPNVDNLSKGEWVRATIAGQAGAKKRAAAREAAAGGGEQAGGAAASVFLPKGTKQGEMEAGMAAIEAGEDYEEAQAEYWRTHSREGDPTAPATPTVTKPAPPSSDEPVDTASTEQLPAGGPRRLHGVMSRDGNGTTIIEVEGMDTTVAQIQEAQVPLTEGG
jgi:hypothetical protein